MAKKEEDKQNPMSKEFTVTSISREDLLHPVIGFTFAEASMVTDNQMKAIASKLANVHSNQILKGSIKIAVDIVIKNKL